MLVFVAIAIASFILVGGSFLFGHDHDVGQDHGDAGHDTDAGGGEPTISIFSTKVLGTLFMGFGAAGAIASLYGMSHLAASLIGLGCGAVLGGVMYLVLGVFYSQQASSLVPTSAACGLRGHSHNIHRPLVKSAKSAFHSNLSTVVTQPVPWMAIPFPRARTSVWVKVMGSQLMVEKAT